MTKKSGTPGNAGPDGTPAGNPARGRINTGPGKLLLTVYGILAVGALSRSIYQLSTEYERAPLAYVLSAVAALVYTFITISLVKGGEIARRAALVCCCLELVGVLVVGTWTLVDSSAFPDSTVWSDYGVGYILMPVILPVTGLLWLRRPRTGAAPGGATIADGE